MSIYSIPPLIGSMLALGIGVLASNGIGKEAFWKALREGETRNLLTFN